MTPLHKLPDGTWVNPIDISEISPRPAQDVGGESPFVNVIHAGHHIALPFADFGEACAYADSLALVVNAARAAS